MGVVGIVVIGRNEGARLIICLQSALAARQREHIVYVDSNSNDGSVDAARELGVSVVELDGTLPHTAARARNAGFEFIHSALSHLEFVQFIDGDCELLSGWLETAALFLAQRSEIAVVCGRTHERYPKRSLYNWLCDQEWNGTVGETEACGGNALFRVKAFEQVGGFRAGLPAGEEPELCLRLRERDWKIWRLEVAMTLHDAAMTRFSQWWSRAARGGYAYGEISQLHKSSTKRIWQRQKLRAIFWAGILPLLLLLGAFLNKLVLIGFLLYVAQICRIAVARGAKAARAWIFAVFMMLAKFAELQGLARYYWSYWRDVGLAIIDRHRLPEKDTRRL